MSITVKNIKIYILATGVAVFLMPIFTHAASLSVSPSTGVYTVGKNFTSAVRLNTSGKSVNAADGVLSFNPKELQVVSVTRAGSIFNLWTQEPSFSNSAGTISFGGGSPTGYSGSSGNIISVTFRALGAGTPKVNFKSGSILAADGLGTNILTSMSGGTYTISAPMATPEPEYIAPANTPSAPVITSSTHSESGAWANTTTASFNWALPSDVTAVRMLLDDAPGTIPTIVYEERLTEKTIEDLDDGISYFHLQFKNADGWGRVAHFKFGIDTDAPKNFNISEVTDSDTPGKLLSFEFDDISPVTKYTIQIDANEPFEYTDVEETSQYELPVLHPGHHAIVVEAFDSAGNSSIASYSFNVEAFDKPVFVDYPSRINTEVIPAIVGNTKPNADVFISIIRKEDNRVVFEEEDLKVKANEDGIFTYVPPSTFERGVYIITATARDEQGRMSEISDEIEIVVEIPGYLVVGTLMINVLSVIVPLIALLILAVVGMWYSWFRFRWWRSKVKREAAEIDTRLTLEFNEIVTNLNKKVLELKKSRKGKLTKAETALIEQIEEDLHDARTKIKSEIEDVENIVK